mgnify:CR=1 FL=1
MSGKEVKEKDIISVDDNTIEIIIYRNSNVDIKSLKVDSIINDDLLNLNVVFEEQVKTP